MEKEIHVLKYLFSLSSLKFNLFYWQGLSFSVDTTIVSFCLFLVIVAVFFLVIVKFILSLTSFSFFLLPPERLIFAEVLIMLSKWLKGLISRDFSTEIMVGRQLIVICIVIWIIFYVLVANTLLLLLLFFSLVFVQLGCWLDTLLFFMRDIIFAYYSLLFKKRKRWKSIMRFNTKLHWNIRSIIKLNLFPRRGLNRCIDVILGSTFLYLVGVINFFLVIVKLMLSFESSVALFPFKYLLKDWYMLKELIYFLGDWRR